ncbi:MAG: metallophosphoesterase [Ignavibacterium sp.]|jgi:predicted MPP superfamily phosphohydrolase|nr:metallophosphoesterase [Ignavibacterium sp.]
MWIIIRVIIAIVLITILEYYFVSKLKIAFKVLLSRFPIKKQKIFINTFLLLLNLYPALLIINSIYAAITKQSPWFPDNSLLDYFLIYPFWFLFILVIQLVIYYLVFDLLKLVIFPIYKKNKDKFVKYESIIIFILLLFFVVYIPARIIYDYNSVDVNRIIYKKKNLSDGLNGFKIAFISDVQADRYTDDKRLKNFIDAVNNENPDLILIAGDIITSTPNYINKAAEYIGMLKADYGVYSCVGDHDNWAYRQDTKRSISEITDALEKHNVSMISDSSIIIPVNNSDIGITFITNTYVESVPKDILEKLSKSNHSDLKIMLTHQPKNEVIKSAKENNFDLFLAGHTHGGQITLLFPFIQLTPTLVETTFIKGVRYYGNMMAIVTRGLGMSLAPIRYNSTPEIVIITLAK